MAERTIISWNITNWITVILMFAVFYFVIGAAVSMGRSFAASRSSLTNADVPDETIDS